MHQWHNVKEMAQQKMFHVDFINFISISPQIILHWVTIEMNGVTYQTNQNNNTSDTSTDKTD